MINDDFKTKLEKYLDTNFSNDDVFENDIEVSPDGVIIPKAYHSRAEVGYAILTVSKSVEELKNEIQFDKIEVIKLN